VSPACNHKLGYVVATGVVIGSTHPTVKTLLSFRPGPLVRITTPLTGLLVADSQGTGGRSRLTHAYCVPGDFCRNVPVDCSVRGSGTAYRDTVQRRGPGESRLTIMLPSRRLWLRDPAPLVS